MSIKKSGCIPFQELRSLLRSLDRPDQVRPDAQKGHRSALLAGMDQASASEETDFSRSDCTAASGIFAPGLGADPSSKDQYFDMEREFETFLKMKMEEGSHSGSESSVGDYVTVLDPNGMPLENDSGDLLINFDPEREYTEEESTNLAVYAAGARDILASYQGTRRLLNSSEKSRGFFKPSSDRGRSPARSSSRDRTRQAGKTPPPPKWRGSAAVRDPKRSRFSNSTASSSAGPPKVYKGTEDDLKSRTRCFCCGELGHISRECKQPPPPGFKPVKKGASKDCFLLSWWRQTNFALFCVHDVVSNSVWPKWSRHFFWTLRAARHRSRRHCC